MLKLIDFDASVTRPDLGTGACCEVLRAHCPTCPRRCSVALRTWARGMIPDGPLVHWHYPIKKLTCLVGDCNGFFASRIMGVSGSSDLMNEGMPQAINEAAEEWA